MDLESQFRSSRRHFVAQQAAGIGSLALAWLLSRDAAAAPAPPAKPALEKPTYDLKPKQPAGEPKARAMISLFMQGGPSHVDMFDPKPELDKRDGTDFTGGGIKFDSVDQASSKLMASKWKFSPQGQCGMELSELLPHLGKVADDITLIRSMHTGVNNHGQSILALCNGRTITGRPALGSWLTYALGSESDNLPAYVVLTDPANLPVEGVYNWANGWLPSLYQGTVVRAREPRILNLDPPTDSTPESQQRYLDFLAKLNQEHLKQHPGENDLAARIASYELAAKMQTAAREALDLSQETEETKRLYGIDQTETRDWGSRCLLARRLVERGVRFVQVCSGNQHWDHHSGIHTSLPLRCKQTDQPTAALVFDLKRRGLLNSTLVHWSGEMGRLPVIQKAKSIGRDHNTYGFSAWLAGGGVKGGYVHGETDEFGHKAVKDVVNHYDLHATILQQFGLDHSKLTFARPQGAGSLIDGQPAQVVKQILA
ncbi:DUF1501 domain-containing protein [Anatilimnocola sp. NA78]|uniref:DUF1501 domain-containing protein n=1 Tax=Anatilimnocola sp. NA78 TaxID=3415683 RepID=UPI003CE5A935